MANPNGAKGSKFERDIADWLKLRLNSERIDRRVRTFYDKGDIAGVMVGPYRLAVECKNHARMELARWVDEADIEARNDHALAGIVIHKRRGKGDPAEQYVTLNLRDFALILRAMVEHP